MLSVMTIHEIRSEYLRFFKEKEHAILPSSSLVPNNDLAKYPDNDGDLFPKGCCGNDGSNYINKKSPKDIGYCSDKDEETADADRDPRKHPAYSYKKS